MHVFLSEKPCNPVQLYAQLVVEAAWVVLALGIGSHLCGNFY